MAGSRVDREALDPRVTRGRARLESLTGLRFLAALAVFGNHAGDQFLTDSTSAGADALQTGRAGVSFFFVLSGFVLTWSRTTADGTKPFYRRRFARVFPNHAVAWVIALAVLAVEGSRPGALGALLSFFLLQSWSPSGGVHFAVNPVAWTLSCELFFYLAFPLVIVAFRWLPPRLRTPAIALLAASTFAIAASARLLLDPEMATWFVYIFPPARLPEFLIGVLLALEVADGRYRRVALPGAAMLVVAIGSVLWLVPSLLQPVAVPLLPFVLLIVASAQADIADGPSPFRRWWLVRLGQWSFAFYLLHELVLRVAGELTDLEGWSAPASVAGAVALAGVAVGASALMFHVVERPAEWRLR